MKGRPHIPQMSKLDNPFYDQTYRFQKTYKMLLLFCTYYMLLVPDDKPLHVCYSLAASERDFHIYIIY